MLSHAHIHVPTHPHNTTLGDWDARSIHLLLVAMVCVSVAQYGCVHQTSFSSCQQSVWTTTCHSSSSSPFSSQSCRWASFTTGRVRSLPSTARVSSHKLMQACACVLWLPHPVKLQQLQEQCYPFLAVCVCVCVCVCVQCFHVSRQSASAWDFQRARGCWCVWLCRRSANTPSWSALKVSSGKKNPFPLMWIRLQLVLHLAFCSDASPAEQRLFPRCFPAVGMMSGLRHWMLQWVAETEWNFYWQSIADLKKKKIQSWCVGGQNDSWVGWFPFRPDPWFFIFLEKGGGG